MRFWIPATLASLALLGAVTAAVAAPDTTASADQAAARGEYESLVEAATAKRREAEALALGGPCRSADQCAVLRFEGLGQCTAVSHKAYSLVSATARAAKAAAADYAALAQQVHAMVPVDAAAACAPSGNLWRLECVSNKCVRTEQGLWPEEGGKARK